jgi:predicted glycoside hydrolase/deacetylase ChbG (UPF0249 family)
MEVPRQLIVNADDYGRSAGVSRGILEAHRQGIVTSTTVMVNQPGVESHLTDALACPNLGLGLHLVFSAWRPVLQPNQIAGLVDDEGRFLDQHTLWAHAADIPLDSLRAELGAQVDRFTSLTGSMPDHLDCHHFVHLYPPFFQVYAELAQSRSLPLRVPFPTETAFQQATQTLVFLEGFPQDLVRGMIVTNSALVGALGLLHPDHFVGSFFGRSMAKVELLLAILDSLPEGTTELMCHPGYDGPGLSASTYRLERETELSVLTSSWVQHRIQDLGIDLVTFGALRPQYRSPGASSGTNPC